MGVWDGWVAARAQLVIDPKRGTMNDPPGGPSALAPDHAWPPDVAWALSALGSAALPPDVLVRLLGVRLRDRLSLRVGTKAEGLPRLRQWAGEGGRVLEVWWGVCTGVADSECVTFFSSKHTPSPRSSSLVSMADVALGGARRRPHPEVGYEWHRTQQTQPVF